MLAQQQRNSLQVPLGSHDVSPANPLMYCFFNLTLVRKWNLRQGIVRDWVEADTVYVAEGACEGSVIGQCDHEGVSVSKVVV